MGAVVALCGSRASAGVFRDNKGVGIRAISPSTFCSVVFLEWELLSGIQRDIKVVF